MYIYNYDSIGLVLSACARIPAMYKGFDFTKDVMEYATTTIEQFSPIRVAEDVLRRYYARFSNEIRRENN